MSFMKTTKMELKPFTGKGGPYVLKDERSHRDKMAVITSSIVQQ